MSMSSPQPCSPPATATAPSPTERSPLLRRLTGSEVERNRSNSIKTQHKNGSRRRRTCFIATVVSLVVLTAVVAVALTLSGSASSIVLSLLSSLSSLSTCSTCFTLLLPIRQLALLGDAAFTNTFTSLCIDLHIQPADVCRGALERQGPAIAQSLRQIQPNKRTAAAFCSKMFGLCSSRGESIPDLPRELFMLPNVTRQPHTKPSGKRKKVVQISDIHIDRFYKEGSEANCARVMCCRENTGPLDRLLEGDSPVAPAGPFGHPNCDAPFSLFKSMLEAIKTHASDAAFIISTGDIASRECPTIVCS